jgi:hypothetical protein
VIEAKRAASDKPAMLYGDMPSQTPYRLSRHINASLRMRFCSRVIPLGCSLSGINPADILAQA